MIMMMMMMMMIIIISHPNSNGAILACGEINKIRWYLKNNIKIVMKLRSEHR